MTIRLSERFFLVTYPDVPLYRVETVILDSNAVSAIYDWAQGKTEPNSADVIPMLDALRSVKHIELFYGAYESCWQFERGAPVSQSNFNMVRIHDFKFKVLAIDSVTRADKKDFNEWISPSRRGSINFLPEEETRLKHFKPDDETFKSLAQASMQEWVLYLLLLKHLRPVWDSEDIQELIASFKAWVDEVYEHRVGMLSIPTFVALMGFFRGSVTEQYFIAKTKFPQGGKTINRDLLLKKDRWEVDGLVRVARNLAFDAIYFRERIRWQSGIIQSPSKSRILPSRNSSGSRVPRHSTQYQPFSSALIGIALCVGFKPVATSSPVQIAVIVYPDLFQLNETITHGVTINAQPVDLAQRPLDRLYVVGRQVPCLLPSRSHGEET